MNREREIYAKEEQIKLIDVILTSLCVEELSGEGRFLLRKMKNRLKSEVVLIQKLKRNTTEVN